MPITEPLVRRELKVISEKRQKNRIKSATFLRRPIAKREFDLERNEIDKERSEIGNSRGATDEYDRSTFVCLGLEGGKIMVTYSYVHFAFLTFDSRRAMFR